MAKTRFTTPVMRFVQGSVDEPQTKDAQGNPRVVKTGPNAGQPNPQYFVAGAIAKNDPAWPAFWASLVQAAYEGLPNLFPYGADPVVQAGGPTAIPQGYVVHPQFAFKVLDGDGYDTSGKPNSNKEGFAGHWVVRFASSYPPRCFFAGRYAAAEQIQEKNAVRRGFYIRVNGTVEGNGNAQRPGIYVNLDMVELAGIGPEIVSGPDASDAFGGGPGALPAGATAMPPGGAGAPPPGAGAPPPPPPAAPPPPPAGPQRPTDPAHIHAAGTPQEQWFVNGAWMPAPLAPPPAAPPPPPGAGAPPPPGASSAAGSPPPPPYTGFMQPGANGGAPAPAAAPPPAPPAAPPPPPPSPATASHGRVMLPAAAGQTYDAMIAAGWTDDTLRQHGMMQ